MTSQLLADQHHVLVRVVGSLDREEASTLTRAGLDAVAHARERELPLVFDLDAMGICDAFGAAALAEVICEAIRADVTVRLGSVSATARDGLERHGLSYFVRTCTDATPRADLPALARAVMRRG